MPRLHRYKMNLQWTGNNGSGTSGYTAYRRDHHVSAATKTVPLPLSSDKAFRGDDSRYSPEELLVASLSSCHMLWFLHLCADAGIVVTAYSDEPEGTMTEHASGAGEFVEVVLHPRVTLDRASAESNVEALHHQAHELCFIARSVNFPVRIELLQGSVHTP
jgi:organic hydroperoxide reductase OsmC/OhrA